MKMTAVEIATGIIDKLQEENRALLDTLHKAQDQLKQQDNLLAKRDQLIKVLEEKVKRGNDGILEMTNRQKELSIKHLEMQLQTLLKENEDLDTNIENIKANICAKCTTKLLLNENKENKSTSKYNRPIAPTTSKVLFDKKSSQNLCPNRMKSLERIIEHKDKRIASLTKEVQRLTKIEKELTQKTYRLSKLLPLSHLPSETLTDCLLQEIQLLESKNQTDGSASLKNIDADYPTLSSVKSSKNSVTNIKRSLKSQQKDNLDESDAENEVLRKKLQNICESVNELRRLFHRESEKLSHELNCTSAEYNRLKTQLESIINELNDVVRKMCGQPCENTSHESDDTFVISRLQERLKESLDLVFEYESEIKTLNEKINSLKKEVSEKEQVSKVVSSPFSTEKVETNDVKKLKEIIKTRESQLEAAQRHISACEKFIEELQKNYKHVSLDDFKLQKIPDVGHLSASEPADNHLRKKLEVNEKTIETCKGFIEKQQNTIKKLEDENDKLENELISLKRMQSGKLGDSASPNVHSDQALSKKKLELTEKVKSLEENIRKLESELQGYDNIKADLEAAKNENEALKNEVEAYQKQKSSSEKDGSNVKARLETATKENEVLKKHLEESNKRVSSLEKQVNDLQEKLFEMEEKCLELNTQIQQFHLAESLADKYESDINSLKLELESKDEEIRDLKTSLQEVEIKAAQMNHFRNSLHKEIEKLCGLIMENDQSESDHSKRRAIYKAAVMHSAKALLNLDEDFNLKERDPANNSALEEMKHQIEVYLTEVSRINELVTIKEQQRDELLREYLDLNDNDQPAGSSGRISSHPTDANPPTSSTSSSSKKSENEAVHSPRKPASKDLDDAAQRLKMLEDEIATTKSVMAYMMSNCARLENILVEEKTERAKCSAQLESHKETVRELKSQLSAKNTVIQHLNSMINVMRSKECTDEIALEQLKSEIKWLVEENQKIFEKVTKTQCELCQLKEKNSLIENDLDSFKRQLMNEKYAHSKVLNELKHLRAHVSQCTALTDTNDT